MQLTEKLILDCLSELKSRRQKYKLYNRYYKGEHDIINNYMMQDSRSNMKVVCNFPKRFINEEISYTLANPINYISISDDIELVNTIDLYFSHWSKVHDIELLKQSQIFGESYELQYINSDGEFRACVLTPLNSYVLEAENADRDVVLALHLFRNRFDSTEYLDVYYGSRIIHYKIGGSEGIEKIGEDAHIFAKVPVTVCGGNLERKSMIDDIKTLNDAFNQVLSDLVNEVSDFRNAFLQVVGASMEEDDIAKLKKMGVIQVPTGGEVSWLIKNINDTFVQNLLESLEKKIYQMASHVDTNEKLQPNTSSLALRTRLIALENKCSLMQAMIEQAIKQRLKRFFEYLKIKTGKEYDYRTIKLKFTSNVPSDIVSISQVVTQLQNTISQETALSLLPFVENPKLELEKFMKEKEMMGIDLDQVTDNEQQAK